MILFFFNEKHYLNLPTNKSMTIKLDYRPNFRERFQVRLNSEGIMEVADRGSDYWGTINVSLKSFSLEKSVIDEFESEGTISNDGYVYLYQLKEYVEDISSKPLINHFKATLKSFLSSDDKLYHLKKEVSFNIPPRVRRRKTTRR
jgi:hypothetical protein